MANRSSDKNCQMTATSPKATFLRPAAPDVKGGEQTFVAIANSIGARFGCGRSAGVPPTLHAAMWRSRQAARHFRSDVRGPRTASICFIVDIQVSGRLDSRYSGQLTPREPIIAPEPMTEPTR
jgi:hypothetical protein